MMSDSCKQIADVLARAYSAGKDELAFSITDNANKIAQLCIKLEKQRCIDAVDSCSFMSCEHKSWDQQGAYNNAIGDAIKAIKEAQE